METKKLIMVKNGKSTFTTYLLWALLWEISAHRLYLEKFRTAVMQVILTWGGVALTILAIIAIPNSSNIIFIARFEMACLGLGALGAISGVCWTAFDLFCIPSMVRKANREIARDFLIPIN